MVRLRGMSINGQTQDKIMNYLKEICDPEIPVINIVELGIVRSVKLNDEFVEVSITPTYSGCPAMHVIKDDIVSTLKSKGFPSVTVKTVYSPAWTTEWMTEEAKEKLKNYGIAPPTNLNKSPFIPISATPEKVECPFCRSDKTELKSRFGSTACKSFYYCNNCLQVFEHFKSF